MTHPKWCIAQRRLGGGDMTDGGSCFSLALAYIGNIKGYDVLDFSLQLNFIILSSMFGGKYISLF